jgi:starch-binding outer membrane protein, SusD/RagB family
MNYEIRFKNFIKRCLVLPALLLFIFSSCKKDILVEKPLDFLTPSNAYTTLDGIKQGIFAVYDNMRTWFSQDANTDWVMSLFSVGTDVSFDGENFSSQTFLTDYSSSLVLDNTHVANMWRYNYAYIQRCNVLIDGINKADSKVFSSEADKNVYLAEAMLFRAFSYRVLVAFFGDVPLVTDVVSAPKTDYVRTPRADVYKQIETDLLFAAANLPVRGKEASAGRVTQGAAWHYLSEIYLAQGKFQAAVDAATKVINDYGYALMTKRFGTNLSKDLFGSGDVYYDLFMNNNQNLSENTEGVWIIQYEPLITGGGVFGGERTYGPRYFSIGKTPDGVTAIRGELVNGVYTGYSDTLGRGVSRCRLTNYVAYDIWKGNWNNDIRNAKHNIKRVYYFDNPASKYDKQIIDWSLYPAGVRNVLKDTVNYLYPYHLKLSEPCKHTSNLSQSGGGYAYKDIYGIRLAETYLVRAEAYLGMNNKDMAAADINKIRTRANATPVLPQDVTLDYILDERARELYGEEQRGYTLHRLGIVVDRVRKYHSNPVRWGASIKDHQNLWPIPQAVIDLNIGAKMEQNPGF